MPHLSERQVLHLQFRNKKALRRSGGILLVITLLYFVCLTGGAVAAGWYLHADHYGAAFRCMALIYAVCAGGMLIAAVLYFCRKDLAAAVLSAVSWLPMPFLLLHAVNTAERMGWYKTLDARGRFGAAEAFRDGMMWNFVPLLILLLLALTRRAGERKAADAEAAPSILSSKNGGIHRDTT